MYSYRCVLKTLAGILAGIFSLEKAIVYQNMKNIYVSLSSGFGPFLSQLMSGMMRLCLRYHVQWLLTTVCSFSV